VRLPKIRVLEQQRGPSREECEANAQRTMVECMAGFIIMGLFAGPWGFIVAELLSIVICGSQYNRGVADCQTKPSGQGPDIG